MQDLYFWVSLPLLLGIGQSSIPNKILEAKNSLETLESHIKKSKEHLDEIADSPDLTEDYIVVMQNQIKLFASLIFRKRQRLIVGSIQIITSRLKEIFREIERDTTSFKTLSPKNLKAICEKIVSQIKKESTSTRTSKEIDAFNKIVKNCKKILKIISSNAENLLASADRANSNIPQEVENTKKKPKTETVLGNISQL